MKHLFFLIFTLSGIILFVRCTNKVEDVNRLFETMETDIEVAKNVHVIYSDSAKVRLKVTGNTLERHIGKMEPKDIFKDGVFVEFLDDNQLTLSWLEAKYLERSERSGLVFVRDSVVLYNTENEKLETSELIWDEQNELIYTDKFVRITQPEKGDTSYGYGFETTKSFKEFKIMKSFSAKMKVEDISSALGQDR